MKKLYMKKNKFNTLLHGGRKVNGKKKHEPV